MIKTIKFFIIFFIILNTCVSSSFAWKTNKGNPKKLGTHEALSSYSAVYFSTLKSCVDSTNVNCGKLKEIGFNEELDELLTWGRAKPAWEWFIFGADKEDAGQWYNLATNTSRFNNHFHNPLKDWENSGLDEWIPAHITGKSSLLWAQDSEYQSETNFLGFNKWPEGDWSWQKTRNNYYEALTATSESDRQEFFARTFKGLGHQAHLLEDKAVPAHVRNDSHPLPWHIEKWVADNPHVLQCLIENHGTLDSVILEKCMQKDENGDPLLDDQNNPVMKYPRVEIVYPDVLSLDIKSLDKLIDTSYDNKKLAKIALLTDTDQYTGVDLSKTESYSIGLAEYTNANFFSDDTIFTEEYSPDHRHYFPYPSKAITNLSELKGNNILPKYVYSEDDIPDGVKCIKKNPPGEEVDCLVRAGYFTDLVDGKDYAVYKRSFILDAPVHESYVKHLVPRAVGYATELINYFFRGRLDIKLGRFIYDASSSIVEAEIFIKNETLSPLPSQKIELIEFGDLDLVYSYIPTGGGEREFHLVNKVYSILNSDDLINSEHISITPALNIPAGAYGISFMVVFKGTLGGEIDAVTGQIYELSNSRIAYGYQPGGQPNTSNIFTISPDGTDPYQITNASEPDPWYFSPAWSLDGTKMVFEKERCIDPNPNNQFCPAEFHLRDIVGIDLLSEAKYPDNVLFERNFNGDSVANASFSPDGTMVAALKRNESGWYYYGSLVVFDLVNNSKWIVNADDDPEITSLHGSAPAWSPAGDKIAYYLNSQYDEVRKTMQFEGDLFLIDPLSGQKTRLTNDDFNNTQPSWSPDGEWIAFSSDRDGEASMDIWLMDKNGENLARLVDCTPASCYSPTFSPDGQTVAFSNGSTIYSVDINGDPYSLKEVAYLGQYISEITWSPTLMPPSFLNVQLEPTAIFTGGSTVLSWQTDRATEVLIQSIAGEQPVNGSIILSPMSTTTYTLTANGPTGTTQTAVTVTVE